jgi:hypothetical protein
MLDSFSLTVAGVETDISSDACSVPSLREGTGELCRFLLKGVAPRPGVKSKPPVSMAETFISSWSLAGLFAGT